MLGSRPGIFWRICWKYITPVILFVCVFYLSSILVMFSHFDALSFFDTCNSLPPIQLCPMFLFYAMHFSIWILSHPSLHMTTSPSFCCTLITTLHARRIDRKSANERISYPDAVEKDSLFVSVLNRSRTFSAFFVLPGIHFSKIDPTGYLHNVRGQLSKSRIQE